MSESTTTRPRPRPKPKARPAPNVNNESSATPEEGSSRMSITTTTSNPDGTRRVIVINDSDDMFIKNKNHSMETWQKLGEINQEIKKTTKDDSSDSDNTTTPKKHKNKRKKKDNHVPLWQRTKELNRFLSQNIPDDDSDLEIIGGSTTPNSRNKRQRSRSRSITPPPALPLEQILNAKAVIRQALKVPARAQSPTFDIDADESADTIVLQPELAAITNEIKEQSHRLSTPAPEPALGTEEGILITVKWKPHPLSPQAQEPELEWQYKIDRVDTFRELFEAVAEDAAIRQENVIMTYQGRRFFPSVTPQILKIWADKAEMVAYDQITYEYIHKNPPVPRYTPAQAPGGSPSKIKHDYPDDNTNGPIEVESDSDSDDPSEILGTGGLSHRTSNSPLPLSSHSRLQAQFHHESDAENDGEKKDGDTFKLILRSEKTEKNITLTVRPTTKCGAIVKAFLKKAGLANQYPGVFANTVSTKDPRLYIDGNKMENDAPIEEAGLEDSDMIDVAGL